MTIAQQKQSDKYWIDESGAKIPVNRLKSYEKNAEVAIYRLAQSAVKMSTELKAFKDKIRDEAQRIYDEFVKEHDGKALTKKGNITLYNFDRSIKVEVRINDQIIFDDNHISLAKQKLHEFFDNTLEGTEDFTKEIVLSAFETTRGRMDVQKVLSLKKYSDRIKDKRYHAAMKMIDNAIRRPSSKTYFVISVKDDSGKYNAINLNLSSI